MSKEKMRGSALVYVSLILFTVAVSLLVCATIIYKMKSKFQSELEEKQAQLRKLGAADTRLSLSSESNKKMAEALKVYAFDIKQKDLELANVRKMNEQLERARVTAVAAAKDQQKATEDEWSKKFNDREKAFAREKDKLLAESNRRDLLPLLPGMKKIDKLAEEVRVADKFFQKFSLNLQKNIAVCTLSASEDMFPVFSLLILSEHGIPIARAVADGSLEIKRGEVRVLEIPLERYMFDEFPEVKPAYYTLRFDLKPGQVAAIPAASSPLKQLSGLAPILQEANKKTLALCQRYKSPGILKSQFEKEYAELALSATQTLEKIERIVSVNVPMNLEEVYKSGKDFARFSREAHTLINEWIALKAKDPFPAVDLLNKAAKAYGKMAVEIGSASERKDEK